ncbi:MAG TPA: hypothetical protein PKA28_12690 [Methylomusa anaerophila]|uniref:WD domain, G-beta repeat n=1 Tax=Methylomusa anaerophila TaxID=1930071 RepID=A0A348AH17_9FIRM|nr:hypothetical protein [Methylomusa anaerophila]BBB90365.1 WD domain, G-beta repeat [Methylomusa anaerophila]HML89289.1 hypothetical protein [Methylomusa anaerophila]
MVLRDDDKEYLRQLGWIFPAEYVLELRRLVEQVIAEQMTEGERQNIREIIWTVMERIRAAGDGDPVLAGTEDNKEKEAEAAAITAAFANQVQVALAAGKPEIPAGMGPEVVTHLVDALNNTDAVVAANARKALGRLTDGGSIDAFCSLWVDSRRQDLAAIIAEAGYVAAGPIRNRVLTVLKTGAAISMLSWGRETVRELIAAAGDSDRDIAGAAREAMLTLTAAAAIDALCEEALNPAADPRLIAWVIAAGYTPQEDSRAALFYCLTEQWEKYFALDWQDHRPLLAAGYSRATTAEKDRFLKVTRRSGNSRLVVELLLGCGSPQDYEQITWDDWSCVVNILADRQAWADMYRMIFRAPVEWAAEMTLILARAAWQPPPWDRLIWRLMVELCPGQGKDVFVPDGRSVGKLFLRDSGANLQCLAFHPDGKILAGGGGDGRVRLWRIGDEREFELGLPWRTVDLHAAAVTCLAFSPDGRYLATAGADGKAHIWTMPDIKWTATVKGQPGLVESIFINNQGKILAAAKDRVMAPVIRLWQWDGAFMTTRSQMPAGVSGATAVHPGQQGLYSGGKNGRIRFWPLAAGKPGGVVCAHAGPVTALAATDSLLASAGADGCVKIWWNEQQMWQQPAGAAGDFLALSQNGDIAAVGSRLDNTVALFQVRWAKPLAAANHADWDYAQQLAMDASGELNNEQRQICQFLNTVLTAKFRRDIMF